MKDILTAATPTHDVRESRHNTMQRILDALDNVAVDADAIAAGALPVGLSYDVARRARSLRDELAAFRARDLINMRQAAS